MNQKINFPYFQVPNILFDKPNDLKSNELLVLIYLYRCSNQGSDAYPSYKAIANSCCISRPVAIRAVNNLKNKNYIKKTNRVKENKDNETNLYKIVFQPSKNSLPAPSKKSLPGVVNGDDQASKRALPNKELMDEELMNKDISSIIELYHSNCPSLPKVLKITDARKRTIKARLKKYSLEQLEEVFKKAEASDFLSGRSGKWTSCNMDWLLNENNLVKVLEGNYQNRGVEQANGNRYKTNGKLNSPTAATAAEAAQKDYKRGHEEFFK